MGFAPSSTRLRVLQTLGAACVALVTLGAQSAPPAGGTGQQSPPPAPAGQQPPPQVPPPQQPPSGIVTPPAPAQPTFSVQVNLVTTDVIARDGAGQFVADLERKDLQVFEDGVKQEIASLVLVHGGRVYNLQLPPPQPSPEGIVLPTSRPTNDAAGRIFLLFVDDLHLDFKNTARIRDLFKRISKTLIHDGDMFGIVSTGPSSLAIDLTYDRRRLDEAIKRMTGNGLKPSDILEAPQTSQGPSEVRYRAHVAFSTLGELVEQLERVQNRRKAIIYVSNGYDFNPFPDGRLGEDKLFGTQDSQFRDPSMNDSLRQGQQFADAELAADLSRVTRAANRANASIYTIDPRGLVGGPDIDEQVDPTEWQTYVRKTQDSLRVMADLTGGIAVVNQNDFDRALKRIDAETSDYYILGYYSTNPDPTRRTRKVEVKTERKDVDIWARSSYSLKQMRPPSSQK